MNHSFVPTIRQLRAFVAVYQSGRLGTAAQRLFVTQSAVSMLLRQLEDGLDTRLFDRTTRSLQPTAAATDMLPTAERILRDVDALAGGFRDLATLERGRVAVAITPTLAGFLLPEAVRRFGESHPGVRVVVDDCAPDQFVARVLGEHVDFGLGTPERPGADIETAPLLRDHLAFVCRRDHPLASRRSIRWTDLAGQPVITSRGGYGVALEVANEVSFLSTALWMTASGLGPSVMPSAFARAGGDADLAVIPLSAPRVSRDISVVTRRGRSLSAASRSFIEVLRAQWDQAD